MCARIKFLSDGYQQIFSDYTYNPKRAGGFSLSKWADCADCQISWLQQILRVSDQVFSDWAEWWHCARTWLLFWWTTVRLQWRGLRHPWEGETWWTEGSRLETRWRFCKTLLNRVPHSSRVWKDKTHTHAVPVEGKRAKSHVPHACKSIPASIWPLHTQVKYAACPIITC